MSKPIGPAHQPEGQRPSVWRRSEGAGAVTHNSGYAVCPGHPGAAGAVGDIYATTTWSQGVGRWAAGQGGPGLIVLRWLK